MASATRILPQRYRDEELIAHGAMGEVYRATDTQLDRTVAVKLLAEPFVADEAARRRFTREARAAARVSGDPNIVTIYDVGESAERPFIVMEYVDGSSLEARLREHGRESPQTALRWLEQAGRALDHAHANGIVHRDVKPGNLLLDRAKNVHVADFGVASAAWLPSLTVDGTVLGTAGYLAPEQASGERTSPASDRYALGVVAYELLTGRRPFERESPTAEAAAHVHEPVPPVGEPALDAVFGRALAKRPDERYATSAELVAALRAALDQPSMPTRPYAVERPPRWPLAAAGLGAILIVAVVLAVVFSGNSAKHAAAAKQHTSAPTTTSSPQALTDRAFALMQRGNFAAALPLLERAVQRLQGTGPASPYEGYANYNLGYTLLQLGRCPEALTYLQRAQALEPHRAEVRTALDSVQRCLAPAPPPKKQPEKKHEEKHKGHH